MISRRLVSLCLNPGGGHNLRRGARVRKEDHVEPGEHVGGKAPAVPHSK